MTTALHGVAIHIQSNLRKTFISILASLFASTMASYCVLLLGLFQASVLAAPTVQDGFAISAYRSPADKDTISLLSISRKIHRRQSSTLGTAIDSDLYWYGNFTVGESTNLGLLIDTGSSDLILNGGLYKPSKYATPYEGSNFTISYEGVDRQGFGFETVLFDQGALYYADFSRSMVPYRTTSLPAEVSA
jgi:hypothetical protein